MSDIDFKKIGKRIQKTRKEQHYTQGDVAEMLNVTQKHISEVERGESMFSMKQLIRYCENMDCSMDYLILGNSTNTALSGLPGEIIDILNGSDADKRALLQRYLRMFVEMIEY